VSIQLLGVSARDSAGVEGRSLGRLFAVSATLGPGLHAVLGRAGDGTAALCEVVAGRARPRAGKVTVAGKDPNRSPATRRHIGAFLATIGLADLGTVAACIDAVAGFGRPNVRQVVAQFGLESWHDRRLRALSASELRSLDLALALAVERPVAVVLHQPFDAAALLTPGAFDARLAAFVDGGACVVVTTSRPADVAQFAGHVHLLGRGRWIASDDAVGLDAHHHELAIWLDGPGDAQRLAAALSRAPNLHGVAWEAKQGEPGVVWVRARDPDEAARAVASAAAETALAIRAVEPVTPTLEGAHEEALRRRARAETAGTRPA
jgi:ABC-2 type transport system ATP-binding protein